MAEKSTRFLNAFLAFLLVIFSCVLASPPSSAEAIKPNTEDRKFSCVAWYNDRKGLLIRKELVQQPYDEEYFEVEINEITYGMLFSNAAKFEPGFIIYDSSSGSYMTTEGAMRRIPGTLIETASAHYYWRNAAGEQMVAQLSCFLQ